jgi:hypothetical protein
MWRCGPRASTLISAVTGRERSTTIPRVEELVVRSQSKIRADVVHTRITAMGFPGGERTTHRIVAEAKAQLA